MKEKIKWGCIQPLTGGMYIGAEKAFGYPASWIISYPGLSKFKMKKDKTIGSVGNEYNLLEWLKRNEKLPPYFLFNKKPTDGSLDTNVEIIKDDEWSTTDMPDFEGTDIVVSVPVCSGLSSATAGITDENRNARNCNMLFNAKYALSVIKPKVYVFENAPALFGNTNNATKVKNMLIDLANEYGYSLVLYKTDTKFHGIPQKRPRTFCLFIKYRGEDRGCPDMNRQHLEHLGVLEYLNQIPNDATQLDEICPIGYPNKLLFDWIKTKWPNYREEGPRNILDAFIKYKEYDSALEYLSGLDDPKKESAIKLVNRIYDCFEVKHKGIYMMNLGWPAKDVYEFPACMFKSTDGIMHPTEERLLSVREWLHMMGHPHDFEMLNGKGNMAKIGQNVPVNTAKFIVSEAIRIVENWDSIERPNSEVYYFDNTK